MEFGENLRKQNEVALVIDGKTLKYAMGCDLKKDFLDLCISCKVVVCCRVSPIQKAEVSCHFYSVMRLCTPFVNNFAGYLIIYLFIYLIFGRPTANKYTI
jgi:hypothetical protein